MRVAVIGSGPGGTAAAHALLGAGLEVEMLDGGRVPDAASEALAARIRARVAAGEAPDAGLLRELRNGPGQGGGRGGLARGVRALLGAGVEAGRVEKRILGSDFVFEGAEAGIPLAPVAIPRSLARGGLSNVWGAACYALRDDDRAHWPLAPDAFARYHARATELLGVVQHEDDLARAYPLRGLVTPRVARNPGSAAEGLLAHWERHATALADRGFAAGRVRGAVRAPGDAGDGCRRCGLCVYGCAFGSIYSTRRTLPALERRGLRYRGGSLVLSFREESDGVRVRMRADDGSIETHGYAAIFLAAGTLSSLRIAADSLGEHDRPAPLLDNDMLLLPLLYTRGLVGGGFRSRYTLGEAALALEPGRIAERGLHLQLYSFHEFFLAELGPTVAGLPRALQHLLWAPLNNLLVAFSYTAGSESRSARGRVRRGNPIGCVEVEHHEHPEQAAIQRRLLRELWSARRELGVWPLSRFAKRAPLGFSGHLSGSLPMRREPGPLESDPEGRLHGTRNVYVVDAASFPDLPAQNSTYTLVANALRVADAFAAREAVRPA